MNKKINSLSKEDFAQIGIIMDQMSAAFQKISSAQKQFNESVERFYSLAHDLERLYEKTLE